jgi:hypothetical protein
VTPGSRRSTRTMTDEGEEASDRDAAFDESDTNSIGTVTGGTTDPANYVDLRGRKMCRVAYHFVGKKQRRVFVACGREDCSLASHKTSAARKSRREPGFYYRLDSRGLTHGRLDTFCLALKEYEDLRTKAQLEMEEVAEQLNDLRVPSDTEGEDDTASDRLQVQFDSSANTTRRFQKEHESTGSEGELSADGNRVIARILQSPRGGRKT